LSTHWQQTNLSDRSGEATTQIRFTLSYKSARDTRLIKSSWRKDQDLF